MFDNYTEKEKKTQEGLAENIKAFARARQEVMKAIKKCELNVSIIKNYETKLIKFRNFMIKNKNNICKLNNTQKSKYPNILNDIEVQLDWCYKQYDFNKEISKGKIKK